jgi:MEDS: MEthanogen/methylotroph, DcmR Sensory domain
MGSGGIDLEGPLAGTFDGGACPHMSILLDTFDDVPAALASFYALGLRRGGWLFHRSLPGEADADRAALTEAGLPVAELEAEDRMEIYSVPLTDPPETWAEPWIPVVERQLARGFEGVWWSRFPVAPDERMWEIALRYDRYWEAAFHGRQAVSLCVYVVGGLGGEAREERVRELREIHDQTIVVPADRSVTALPRANPAASVRS